MTTEQTKRAQNEPGPLPTEHEYGPWFVVACMDHTGECEVWRRYSGPLQRVGKRCEMMEDASGEPMRFRSDAAAHAAIAKATGTAS